MAEVSNDKAHVIGRTVVLFNRMPDKSADLPLPPVLELENEAPPNETTRASDE
jgi:hypothetical protein